MGNKTNIATGSLSALVFCFGGAQHAHAEDISVQSLEVTAESKMSYEEYEKLLGGRQNAHTFHSSVVTSGNYSDTITAANYSDTITAANYADTVTAANYANMITAGNYGLSAENDRPAEQLPAPQLAQ